MVIEDIQIPIEVREIMHRVPVPESKRNETQLTGTGKMKLCIDESYRKKEYAETPTVTIQEKIPQFIKGLMKRYLDELEYRKEIERLHKEREEKERLRRLAEEERKRIEQQKKVELSKMEALILKAFRFSVYQKVLDYIAEIEKILSQSTLLESSSLQIGKQTKGSEENDNDLAVSELNELKNLAHLLNPFRKIVTSNIDYTSHNEVKTDGANLITETDINLMIKALLPKISN